MTQTRPEPKVIIIPAKEESPQDQEKKKNLRVAAYCRVSTKKDEQLGSYENQKAYYTEKIMANPNWTMADIFADEGITGTSACKRKNFLRMIRQCRKGKIDMIFAKSVSRFARNTVDTLSYTRELRSMGIPVLFEEQNINSIYPESEFLITIHGAFAQSESEGISSRVKWGKHQAMRTGKANIQYKTLLGYEKGPDGEMVVNAEQAETVRKIYELYLSGQTLRNIKETLETGGFKNSAGTTEWTTSNLRTILSDEKYCGDVLLQKTFIRDCISKKVIKNTGQLPMYLIQNHHEAIIPRERFDAVQIELARRRAQTGGTKKSAPTGMSRYSGKYALSGLLFCGECGTAYRRVVWTQHGEKRAVWRCSSRLDYGKKYCKESPTLDESPFQQAVLAAINASMSGRKVLADQLVDAMEQELAPVPGESMSLGDIERAVTELGKQFDTLLAEAANGDADEYAERFRAISTTMEELKRRKTAILSIRQEEEQISRRIHAAASAMAAATVGITEWDDGVVYQMLEKVTVLAGNRIKVTLDEGDIHDAVISAMNELFQTQVARNAVKASISAVLAGEEQTLSLPAVELQIRNLQERQLELFQLIVSAGADCTDYDEELRQVNMAKTKLMAKKAELEKEQRGAAAFEERLAELDAELEQSCGALTDFDELTVRQLVSNIKVLDKDSLLICFKDGTEITQAMQRRQTA